MDILKIIVLIVLASETTLPSFAQTTKHSDAHIGLIYPISTNGREAKEYTNSFSLHALVGFSRAETGLSMSGISTFIMDSASGLQMAGFSNHINNTAHGMQMAGFMNYIRNKASGVQAAGFLNYTGSMKGTSLAGFANINRDTSLGVQVAGFINKAGQAGSQVAGFINIAKKVKGVQIAGFINIADSSDYPIGILNFIKNGEKSVGISTDETLTTLLTFRSGGRKLYGVTGIGYNDKGSTRMAAWEAGIGMHVYQAESFRLNLELTGGGMTDLKRGDYFRTSARILPALRLTRRLEIFAGPSFNYIRSIDGKGEDLITHYLWTSRDNDSLHALYFGITGGIYIKII